MKGDESVSLRCGRLIFIGATEFASVVKSRTLDLC